MGREQRLRKKREYDVVYAQGRSWANSLLVLRALPNGLAIGRWGFSTSRRLGKAVVRNRVRRRLREVIRFTPLKTGWDLVFVVRSAAACADYSKLRAAVTELLERSQLIANGAAQVISPEGEDEGSGFRADPVLPEGLF